MAFYPDAIIKLKPHQPNEGLITPRLVIVHSICGGYREPGLSGLEWLENPNNPLESTFAVDSDSTVYQIRDTNWHCDANLDANDFSISIETESSIAATEPWSQECFNSLIKLIDWCCRIHKIPKIRATAWNGSGIGYHTMWGAPSHWTPVNKDCPGYARIQQFPSLIEGVLNYPKGSSTFMTLTAEQERRLNLAVDQILGAVVPGQLDFKGSLKVISSRVDAVNALVKSNDTGLASKLTDGTTAILTAIAGVDVSHLTENELLLIAAKLAENLSSTTTKLDANTILDALKARLES